MIKIIIIIINISFFIINIKKETLFQNKKINLNLIYKLYLFNSFKLKNNNYKYLKILDIRYVFSFKFNIVKMKYIFGFYDYNNRFISPSEIFNRNLGVTCSAYIINQNIDINSMPNIYYNKYYKCIEYYKINEKINFGIKIYNKKENNNIPSKKKDTFIYFFNEKISKYNEFRLKKDNIFDPYILNKQYISIIKKMKDTKINETLKLKKSYNRYPYCSLKRIFAINENIWYYGNVYNNYFCFCIGFNCLKTKISQKCKYFFNLYLIDNNRNVYKKTDYLFIDFIFSELSSDDSFPVFKEMLNQELPVHYITENIDIFNEFCVNQNKCNSIIYVNKNNYTINGEFIEKYFSLFLKLKQVIFGGGINFNYIK